MYRRTMMAGSMVAAATLALPAAAESQRQAGTAARNVVLMHGLFADGSCWSDGIGRLQASDLNVIAAQNPLTTLDESADAVRRILARMDGPTVLAGHSSSGTIIPKWESRRTSLRSSTSLHGHLMPAKISPRSARGLQPPPRTRAS